MTRRCGLILLFALALLPLACGGSKPAPAAPATVAAPAIDGNAVLEHTKVLASDEYEGRAPGTKGEDLTVTYITEQFKKAGLKPGNPDGTYVQKVPMVGITAAPGATLVFQKGREEPKAQVARRLRRVDQARHAGRRAREVRRGLRRLRRASARVQLGRLQGRGPSGQDDRRARGRPAGAGSCRRSAARREILRRPRDDLLRPLDLQVRDGPEAGRRGRPHRPRDGGGRVSLCRRAGQDGGAVLPRGRGPEHEPRRHRGLDHPRPGQAAVQGGRQGFRRAEEGRAVA